MTAALLHDRLAVAAALFAFALSAWAGWSVARGRGVDAGYFGALVIGQGLLTVQAIVGAVLWLGHGSRPSRDVHVLYGVVALLVWPLVLTLTRADRSRREAALLAAASLVLWGLLLRAIDTALPV